MKWLKKLEQENKNKNLVIEVKEKLARWWKSKYEEETQKKDILTIDLINSQQKSAINETNKYESKDKIFYDSLSQENLVTDLLIDIKNMNEEINEIKKELFCDLSNKKCELKNELIKKNMNKKQYIIFI